MLKKNQPVRDILGTGFMALGLQILTDYNAALISYETNASTAVPTHIQNPNRRIFHCCVTRTG